MATLTKHPLADLKTIAQQLDLSVETVHYCVEVELVQKPLTENDLAELRRVRRLQELEVNLPGIEIILRMRRRMLALQAKMEAFNAEMSAAQARFEKEIQELEQHLTRTV